MEIISFCQKNGKFWGDPAHLDEFVQGFSDSVEAAKKLGASNVIVSDDFYPTDLPREQVHAAMVEGLKRLAPLAEQAGLRNCHEINCTSCLSFLPILLPEKHLHPLKKYNPLR